MKNRLKITFAALAVLSLLLPSAAAAHVTVAPDEAPAEGYAMLTFTVPHGCEADPTNRVSIQMPDQVISATPGVVAGWNINAKEGKLPEPAEQHGETITEGVRQVTWTGGPLASDELEQFPLSVAFSGDAGETAEFKVVQECVGGGEEAWIQSTPASGEEPDRPAPAVVLVAGEDPHGGAEPVSSPVADEGTGDGLAIAALVAGALGLLTGGAALVTARRSKR